MAWTADQSKAIETHGKNLLVSAAAGSGKTAVLVERIIKMILDGTCDIDRMLVVTFTNAAAAEMRSRIHAALAKKISEGGAPDILDRLECRSIIVICINRRVLLSSSSQERTLSHGLDRRSI